MEAGLYRNAAHAAGSIAGYQDVFWELVEDLTFGLAKEGTPKLGVWKSAVPKAAKVLAKRLLVVHDLALATTGGQQSDR